MSVTLQERQKRLSCNLKLLRLMFTRLDDAEKEISKNDQRGGAFRKECALLDTVATVLTSGRPGDVTAVALERELGIGLVIAKNRTPTEEDESPIRRFFHLIEDLSIQKADQVFPFLLSHCRENMEKRLSRVLSSINEFEEYLQNPDPPAEGTNTTDSDRFWPLKRYTPESIDVEFPNTELYRSNAFKEEPSFEEMLRNIIITSKVLCSQCTLDRNDVVGSEQRFSLACLPLGYLLKSRFLETICDVWWGGGVADLQRCAKRLRRRAERVRQYHSGVDSLLRNVRRIFPNGKVPWRWAEPNLDNAYQGPVSLDGDLRTVLAPIVEDSPPSEEKILNKIAQDFPQVSADWNQWHSVNAVVHAEIRLILDLDKDYSKDLGRRLETKAIGCSKRTCLCCHDWIYLYNGETVFKRRWSTSGSSGKPDLSWAFPGVAIDSGLGIKTPIDLDKHLNYEIHCHLDNKLYDLIRPREESPEISPEILAALVALH